ncbi:hypothetical protein BDZ94DRAFT_1248275 [Collybia nuda]|uniref:Lysine-specific metallo-endopeptidase domain-containing protein n=1 Tax=Collybia nuda TaxID=64659 RepID=A0A9P6CIL6_9AGAR|nr:hypothetical protein BDZ94DRAFT_1248275 [Collybia nuda]
MYLRSLDYLASPTAKLVFQLTSDIPKMVFKLSVLVTLSCLTGFALLALPVMGVPSLSSDVADNTLADNVNDVNLGTILADATDESLNLAPKDLLQEAPPINSRAPQATFIGCTIQQQRIITTAVEESRSLIIPAHQFAAVPGNFNSRRFRTWFGAFNITREITVLHNLERMAAANFNTWVHTCGICTSTTQGADFDRTRYGQLSYCPFFWNEGPISRINVLVSRLVQFDSIAGVGNFVTGAQASRDLAISNPNRAIDNAYSYVYFVRNNPPL